MGVVRDLTGKRFGRLVVVRQIPERYKRRRVQWLCVCDCGNEKIVVSDKLTSGYTKSCGCLRNEKSIENIKAYNYARSLVAPSEQELAKRKRRKRIYNCYEHFIRRCYEPSVSNYHNYGGRGIKVCDEWKDDFESFYEWALENGYSDDLTIDRIDVNGDYEPNNCRWVDAVVQANNKRNTVYVYREGKKYTLKQVSEITGVKTSALWARKKNGWTDEELFLPYNTKRRVVK